MLIRNQRRIGQTKYTSIYNSQTYFQKLTHTSVGIFHSIETAEMTALENKSILQNSLPDCTLNNIMFLWRTVMAKVALNHTDICIYFLFFLMGELATLICGLLSNDEKGLLARTMHARLHSELLIPQLVD